MQEELLSKLLKRHINEVQEHFGIDFYSIPERDPVGEETAFKTKALCSEFSGVASRKPKDLEQASKDRNKILKLDEESRLALIKTEEVKENESKETLTRALQVRRTAQPEVQPLDHRKWKLFRVIPGHRGVPKSVSVDPSNRIFATGGMDNVIKVFDVATGECRMDLEGHTHPVRGLSFSPHHAYLISASEDRQIKAWDLEKNQVVRHYHGHTAGVYCVTVHPTLPFIVSGSRDSTCRVWDMRTRQQVHCMTGHKDAVVSICTQSLDPQVVTGSEDSTIRLWDLRAGRTSHTLTHHKKGVRALSLNPSEFSFVSASTGSIKKFAFPEGRFMQNFEFDSDEKRSIIPAIQVHRSGDFIVAGSESGFLKFWDWKSAKLVQTLPIKTLPGSLESESGVQALAFDITGERIIACVGDKTIQMFKPIPV